MFFFKHDYSCCRKRHLMLSGNPPMSRQSWPGYSQAPGTFLGLFPTWLSILSVENCVDCWEGIPWLSWHVIDNSSSNDALWALLLPNLPPRGAHCLNVTFTINLTQSTTNKNLWSDWFIYAMSTWCSHFKWFWILIFDGISYFCADYFWVILYCRNEMFHEKSMRN